MDTMKKFFRSSILTSVLLMVLGGLLIFKSEATIITISYVVGGCLIALGVLALIRYVQDTKNNNATELDIVYGIVTMVLGILVISNPKTLASIIPFILGVCIVVSSSTKLQYAMELKKENNELWLMTMIVAIFSTICGVVLIFNPFKGAQVITKTIGIFIIIYSILDIISTITIRRNVMSIKSAIKETVTDAIVVEEKEEIETINTKNKKEKDEEKKD